MIAQWSLTCIEITFQMNNFNSLYDSIILEADDNVNKIGVFPGAFKPPHAGHFYTALNACEANDIVYIFASDKSRPLSTVKSGSKNEGCDSLRYKNLLSPDSKFTTNMLAVKPAECARVTSASALRAAISTKDVQTIYKNLPKEISDSDRQSIYSTDPKSPGILNTSNDVSSEYYGHVTSEQMQSIWKIYIPVLKSLTGGTEINFVISKGSPVRDTYELVDSINNSKQAGMTSVSLYVGT